MNPNITSSGVLTDSTGTRQLVDKETFNFDRVTNTASDFESEGKGQYKVRAVSYGFVLENNTAFSGGGGGIGGLSEADIQAMIDTTTYEFRREYRSTFPPPNTWPPEKRIHISNNQDTPPIADDDYRLAGTAPNKTWVPE